MDSDINTRLEEEHHWQWCCWNNADAIGLNFARYEFHESRVKFFSSNIFVVLSFLYGIIPFLFFPLFFFFLATPAFCLDLP